VDLRVTVVAAAAQGLAVDRDRPPPRRLGRVRRPLPDRDQRSGAGQHGGDRDGQHRGQRMPAAASLSGVGDLGEVSSRLRHRSDPSATGASSHLAAVGMRDDVGASTVFQRVMGIDAHMIAGVRACLTFTLGKT